MEVPVHWWHGELDWLTPPTTLEPALESVPQRTLTIYPGEGHAIGISHGEEILTQLALV